MVSLNRGVEVHRCTCLKNRYRAATTASVLVAESNSCAFRYVERKERDRQAAVHLLGPTAVAFDLRRDRKQCIAMPIPLCRGRSVATTRKSPFR